MASLANFRYCTDKDRHAWEEWRNADPEHGRAWRHIENINQRLQDIPTNIVFKTLAPNALQSRRRLIKALTVLLMASGTGLIVRQTTPWREWTADYRTGTGEQRKLTLVDGTIIVLNTTSAIDVDYSDTIRLIQLRTGEMFITTAQDRPAATLMRPFVVETAEGTVHALGTRFVVRQENGRSMWPYMKARLKLHLSMPAIKRSSCQSDKHSALLVKPEIPFYRLTKMLSLGSKA
ncbi:FecR domain-containing protein [Candidatus Nitrotoga arctica]|nr:FecR domain-containing protein [Candidatus Nitrotoga arctica]